MEITAALHELAKFSAGTLPVFSVYLNTQWHDQHQRARAATFLTRHVRQADLLTVDTEAARQSLTDDLGRLERWGAQLLNGTAELAMPGRVVFACSGADLWVELPVPVPFEDEFTIADRPVLRQLARLDEDYTNALVVLVDSRAARICEVVLGGFLSETAFANEFPGRHKQGGWAQMRYQRHVNEHMNRHHQEVADYLTAYLTAQPQTQVILSGQDDILANFRRFLPPQVQQRLIEAVRLDIRESPARILEAAQEVLQRHEREEEQASVHLLLHRAGHGGLAVVGVQETLAAVNTGRVHKLVMHRDLQGHGWRCLECERVGEGMPAQCPVCGGQVTSVELGEAMVSGVLRTDGSVELIEPEAHLAAYEGVGALLRYK
jgi:peptide subunit release factor 1 (eRF1)